MRLSLIFFLLLGVIIIAKATVLDKFLNTEIEASSHQHRETIMSRVIIQLLGTCYKDHNNLIIPLESNMTKSLMQGSLSQSVIFLNHLNNSNLNNDISIFLLFLKSISKLDDIFDVCINSSNWNEITPMIILDSSRYQCGNAIEYLQKAWLKKIINVIFLCVTDNGEPEFYTYNPFTDNAPEPWEKVFEYQKDGRRMVAYKIMVPITKVKLLQNYCQSLKFDRTKQLGGSPIYVHSNSLPMRKGNQVEYIQNGTVQESKNTEIILRDFKNLKVLLKSFNATIIVHVHTAMDNDNYYLKKGTDDINIDRFHKHSSWWEYVANYSEFSYPIYRTKLVYMSKNLGLRTPLEMIWHFYGVLILSSTVIILILTFWVILKFEKRGRAFSFFEILRLLINTSLFSRTNTIPLRIYFFVIFLYFLIIHATFQGNLSTFLTKPSLRKNADTLTDLQSRRFTIIESDIDLILMDKIFHLKVRSLRDVLDHLQANKTIDYSMAFIMDCNEIYSLSNKLRIHYNITDEVYFSKDSILDLDFTYVTRKNWPLKENFDKFLMWIEQSGFDIRSLMNVNYNLKDIVKLKMHRASSEVLFRPIKLESLKFIFIFLLFGLFCSCLCFFLEILSVKL